VLRDVSLAGLVDSFGDRLYDDPPAINMDRHVCANVRSVLGLGPTCDQLGFGHPWLMKRDRVDALFDYTQGRNFTLLPHEAPVLFEISLYNTYVRARRSAGLRRCSEAALRRKRRAARKS